MMKRNSGNHCKLTVEQARDAVAIQQAIDSLPVTGGVIELPEMDITLDRGIQLRNNIELHGQGAKTVLRKGPGKVYALDGYHNYGMYDVPLQTTAGLCTGMTVSIFDNCRRGFYETFARITWIDGNWVGLDTGLNADYAADEAPCLTTCYPMIFGLDIQHGAVRNLVLKGVRDEQETAMGSCRGGAVYFCRSRDIDVVDVDQHDYDGDGISFQMCRDVQVRNSQFSDNSGNGIHPGAGSTNCLISGCSAKRNGGAGFFFCVRANYITVQECSFSENDLGVSIGTRDCNNELGGCRIINNTGPGILFRQVQSPAEAHSIWVHNCKISGNAKAGHGCQIVLGDKTHHLIIEKNLITTPAFKRGSSPLTDVFLVENYAEDGSVLPTDGTSETSVRPEFACGYGNTSANAFRHLPDQRI